MSVATAPLAPLARLAAAAAGAPAWRRALFERLLALGLPTPRDDAWKYTNLRLLERRDLSAAAPRPVDAAVLDGLPATDGARLVFVDGRPSPALSSGSLPAGVTLGRLAGALGGDAAPPALAAGDGVDDRIGLLNACLCGDGALLDWAPGAADPAPLHLVHVSSGGGAYPRTAISVGRGARARLVEYHVSLGDAAAFVAAATRIDIADGAALDHQALQVTGPRSVLLDDVAVTVGGDGRYSHRHVALGGQLARLDLRVVLAGRGASTALAGLLMADGSRELHVRTRVAHDAAHTASDQVYRGVAAERGRGSYDGKVLVAHGAAKSDSRQSSRNLLLSPQAEIDARPQLEINADDVKCSHGATTGALDENMLFYLLSRGLERDTARALLTYAFAGDVLRLLEPPALRQFVAGRVLGRLPAAGLIREFVA